MLDQRSPEPVSISVVVASPDPHMRALLGRVLGDTQRFRVVDQADDGRAVLGRDDFDVALADLSISNPGFLELNRQLRSRRPRPVVVAVSHYGPVYVRHALAAEGIADFLVIPEDVPELADRIGGVGRLPLSQAQDGAALWKL